MKIVELSVRSVCENDSAPIASLLNAVIRAGGHTIMADEITADEQVAYLRAFPTRGLFNVAVAGDGGRVVGLQSVEPAAPESERALAHVGTISTFVDLDARRHGIGRRLAAVTLDEARDHGYLKLMAMIRADNAPALSYYRSLGFETVGTARRHTRVRGRFVDEVFTERWLGP